MAWYRRHYLNKWLIYDLSRFGDAVHMVIIDLGSQLMLTEMYDAM